MNDMDYIVADLQRRLANIIRRGKVHSVDFSQTPPRVRVEYAKDAITGWLPFISARQSVASKSTWEPLAIDEGVVVFSESGELALGVVMPSVPDSTNIPPSISPDEHVTKYADGTLIKYDRAAHKLTVDVVGDVSIKSGTTVTVDGSKIKLNGGSGAVTGECVCAFTGKPHADISSLVLIGKE